MLDPRTSCRSITLAKCLHHCRPLLIKYTKWSCFLHAALKMSMQEGSKDSSVQSAVSKVLRDQSFMSSILSSVSLAKCAFLNQYLLILPALRLVTTVTASGS